MADGILSCETLRPREDRARIKGRLLDRETEGEPQWYRRRGNGVEGIQDIT